MALMPIEIIAFIFIVVALLKIVVVIFNKKIWYANVVKPVYGNPEISTFVLILLVLIIFYYVLKDLMLKEVIAVIALTSILMALGFLQYQKELMPLINRIYSKNLTTWQWIYIVFWVFLLILALYEIF